MERAKVLYIDQHPQIKQFTSIAIEDDGHTVVASTGELTVALALTYGWNPDRFNLVVIGIDTELWRDLVQGTFYYVTPEIVIDSLRNKHPETPIVIYSGFSSRQLKGDAYVDRYALRSPRDLLNAIREAQPRTPSRQA